MEMFENRIYHTQQQAGASGNQSGDSRAVNFSIVKRFTEVRTATLMLCTASEVSHYGCTNLNNLTTGKYTSIDSEYFSSR